MNGLAQALFSLTDKEFEHFLGDLWRERGWETNVTPRSGDDGVDVIATRDDHYPQKRLIQAKHIGEEAKLSKSIVQQYSYLHQKEDVDEVLLVTTGGFTSGARHAAKVANVKLINLDALLTLVRDTAAEDKLRRYGSGVDVTPTPKSDDPDYIDKSDIDESVRDEICVYANSRDVYARLLATLGLEDCTLQSRLGVLLQLFRGNEPLHVLLLRACHRKRHVRSSRVWKLCLPAPKPCKT